jgi:hypothetical protein
MLSLSTLSELTGSEEKARSILAYITRKTYRNVLTTLSRLSSLAGGETEHNQRMQTF